MRREEVRSDNYNEKYLLKYAQSNVMETQKSFSFYEWKTMGSGMDVSRKGDGCQQMKPNSARSVEVE